MYISEIKIKNFRVFGKDEVNFVFDKGVNVIIGENNSGKSSLIDAIRIALSCVLYKREIYFNKTDFHINELGERETESRIDVYLKEVPRNLIEIWDPEEPDSGEFHTVFTLEKNSAGYDKVKHRVWGGKCEGNPLSSDTLEAINIAYLGALRDAENEMKPSRNSKLSSLLGTIANSPEEKGNLVDKLRVANNEILQTESISQAKKIINENLLDIEQSLLYQQIDLGLVEPRFESILGSLRSWITPRWNFISKTHTQYEEIIHLFAEDDLKHYIQTRENGAYVDIDTFLRKKEDVSDEIKQALLSLKKYTFELYQNGLGYNNLLFVSAVLGDMSFIKNGIYANVFLVEEPEAHLHPQLQELILNFFLNKVKTTSNIQVIMTSHSPTLVSKVDVGQINLLYEKDHEIFNYPFVRSPLCEQEKDYLEKYLDVTKSQLFFAKGILFVEGISEAILIPEFAKIIGRPLDMYAVELVNINGVGFSPFAKMIKIPDSNCGFAKASIITDDDRCANKDDTDTYISKELDYDDDLTGIVEKIDRGVPSDRFNKISELCSDGIVLCVGATKTLEYELALEENNIPYLLEAIINVYPTVGPKLKEKVDCETCIKSKALKIWLFIRSRDTAKAQVAQELSRILKKQLEEINQGQDIENPFVVPQYIQKAISNITLDYSSNEE